MARQSKVKSLQSKPKSAKEQKITKPSLPNGAGERTDFWCCRCARHFNKQKTNFPSSQSTIYYGNSGFLTICNYCVDDLYSHYRDILEDEKLAIRRICQKFDIYWSDDVFELSKDASSSTSRIRAYISKTNIYRFIGKTYDDTIDEEDRKAEEEREMELARAEEELERENMRIQNENADLYFSEKESSEITQQQDVADTIIESDIQIVPEEIIEFWGMGLPEEKYIELEARRGYWLKQYPEGYVLDPGEEALLRQVCACEIDINHERAAGRSVEKMQNTLNSLLGGMNIKPSQKKEYEDNYIPFGVEIAKWEDEKPVIDPDPEFQDVDGFRKNIVAWFLGQLCKMVGIKNKYSDVYEEELKKYSVERPKFEDDDDENTFDDIFGKALEKPGGESNG